MKTPGRRATTYARAGVDIVAADRAKARIRQLAAGSRTAGMLSGIGGFGGLFAAPRGRRPVLVASADGVGTKLKVAIATGRHDTVGRDLVNHCANDILAQGARPLFFLDYLALGQMNTELVAEVVAGVARGCRENACALLGGETAEMPGFYAPGEYDLAGFIVGTVERDRLITGAAIRPGDRLLGLRSAGLHTNGYALARRVLLEEARYRLGQRLEELGMTVAEALLAEHRAYGPLLAPLLPQTGRRRSPLKGIAHITGGGIPGNLPRILPPGCAAEIDAAAWEWPPIFRLLARRSGAPLADLRRAFNLGIGMILVVAPEDAPAVAARLRRRGEEAIALGRILAGRRQVRYRV
ncbi:MAG: phosphoribosylformylglycinamidine cyclo-ligase [Terriglobales bacterium]